MRDAHRPDWLSDHHVSCRQQIKKMSETKKEEKKRLADEDATRRIKQLEDQVETLRKQVSAWCGELSRRVFFVGGKSQAGGGNFAE